jgi:hypothetical protein
MGFAHSMVPHCDYTSLVEDTSQSENGKHHHHSHHEHNSNEGDGSDHEHVYHENHFDASIYDLVLCVLNDLEHQENDCSTEYFANQKSPTDVLSKNELQGLVSVLIAFTSYHVSSDIQPVFDSEIASLYLSPPLSNSSSRGPPTNSC